MLETIAVIVIIVVALGWFVMRMRANCRGGCGCRSGGGCRGKGAGKHCAGSGAPPEGGV